MSEKRDLAAVERRGLVRSLTEHPGWVVFQSELTSVIEFVKDRLASKEYPSGTDHLVQLADIRSLQREIMAYKWVRDVLPDLLTAERPVPHSEEEGGAYEQVPGEAGQKLAGQDFYEDEPRVAATPSGE